MTSYTPLALGDAALFYTTGYDGTKIGDATEWSDFSWPSMVTDPDTYYRLELDVTTDAGIASYDGIAAYSLNDVGDPDSSSRESLAWVDGFTPGTSTTVTLTFGPGRDQWDDRVTHGESRVLIDMPDKFYVTGARWGVAAVTGYSDWLNDTSPLEQSVSGVTSEGGVPGSDPATRWGWQSDSTDHGSDAAAEAGEAWSLGGTVTPPGSYETAGFGTYAMGGGTYGIRWAVSWLTVTNPATAYTNPGTLTYDPLADPDVLGIEWDTDGVLPDSYRAVITPKGASGWSFAYGKNMPVKYVAGVGTRYEPAPEAAAAMNARATVATVGYSSGGAALSDSIDTGATPGSTFAVALVDPWTAAGIVAPFDTVADSANFYIQVQVFATYRPRYRLIYGTTEAPEQPYGRVHPRDDAHGTSRSGRLFPRPTSRQTPGRGFGYY